MERKDFIVECDVCGQRYKNHVGSTECCGSIAFVVKDDKKTEAFMVYGLVESQNK